MGQKHATAECASRSEMQLNACFASRKVGACWFSVFRSPSMSWVRGSWSYGSGEYIARGVTKSAHWFLRGWSSVGLSVVREGLADCCCLTGTKYQLLIIKPSTAVLGIHAVVDAGVFTRLCTALTVRNRSQYICYLYIYICIRTARALLWDSVANVV